MKRWLPVLLLLLVGSACAAPNPSPTPAGPSPTPSPSPIPTVTPEPKQLTVCLSGEPDSLYLYGVDSPAAEHIWQALYDGPIDSRDYRHQPIILTEMPSLGKSAVVETTTVQDGDRVLAASGSVMQLAPGVIVKDAEGKRTTFRGEPIRMERMVVTFTLRSDVRWSDGKRVTADDSVYAFELAASPATPADKHVVERTADYRALSERQVVWESVPGFLDRGYFLNFWHPLPRHAWRELSPAELLTAERSTRAPLGWGPFSIQEWIPGGGVIMERNPFYFRASEGLPRVDEIVFRFIPDADGLTRRLLAGTCDLVTHEASAALDLDELRSAPAVETITTADGSWELLAFGISPADGYDRPDFFEDVRVRRAIAQCVDRQGIVDELFGEGRRVLDSYLPPEHPAYAADDVTRWPYDPQAAQSLLAQAGWYDEDGDGIREAHGIPGIADGTPYQISYKTTDAAHRVRTAREVEAQLQGCGIRVAIRSQPAEVFFAPGPEGELFGRQFDLAHFAWETGSLPLCDAFLSSQIPGPGNWSKPNVAGFIDPSYDEACQEAVETLPGDASYADRHAVPQRIFSRQLPVLPLYQGQKTTAAQTRVTGLLPNPSERSELWNVELIDIEQ